MYRNVIVLCVLVVATAALFSAFTVAVFITEIEAYLVVIYAAASFFLNIILYLPAGVSGNQGITA